MTDLTAEFIAEMQQIREARGCRCKRPFAECLCGLSWENHWTLRIDEAWKEAYP